jgi:hypothetical protein
MFVPGVAAHCKWYHAHHCIAEAIVAVVDMVVDVVVLVVDTFIVDPIESLVNAITLAIEGDCADASTVSGEGACLVGGGEYKDHRPFDYDCKDRATCTLTVTPVHGDVLYTVNCDGNLISRADSCYNSLPFDGSVYDFGSDFSTLCSDTEGVGNFTRGLLQVKKDDNQLTLKADLITCRDGESFFFGAAKCDNYDPGNDDYHSFSCTASYTPITPASGCLIQAYTSEGYWGEVIIDVYDDGTYDYAQCPDGGAGCIYDRGEGLAQGPGLGRSNDPLSYSPTDSIPSPVPCTVSAISGGWKLSCILTNPVNNALYEENCFAYYSIAPGDEFDVNETRCKDSFGDDAWIVAFPPTDTRQIDNKCCGDDADDSGALGHALIANEFIDNHSICDFDFNQLKWSWEPAQEYTLNVKEINNRGTSNDFVSNGERWYKCDENNIGPVVPDYTNAIIQMNYEKDFARFYCYKEGNNYRYAACTTDTDTDFLYEIEPEEKKKDLGSITTTMLSDDIFYLDFTDLEQGKIDIDDLDAINDWSDYETLEFFVMFSDIRTPLNLKILAPDINNWKIFGERVLDYATSALDNNEWIHIAVPIKEWKDIKLLNFELAEAFFVDTVEIKNIFLRPKDIDNFAYCSDADLFSEALNMWIDDLDLDVVGQRACDSIPSYDWTGTKCCGDDFPSGTNRFSYINEYYNDLEEGCYASIKIDEHSTFMELKYEITKTYENITQNVDSSLSPVTTIQSGITTQVNQICNSDSCVYPLPQERPLNIINLYPEDYDLFVNEIGNKVLINDIPVQINEADAFIQVENVLQNILFYDNSFYGCDVPESISQTHGLIQDVNSCDVKGNYFCSMQGAWSNETEGVDCPSDYCWDGVTCIEDMSESGNITLIVGQYLRCVAGNWVEPIIRYNWDNDNFSFCAREDQCFVDPDGTVTNDDMPEMYVGLGNPQNPRCIANGQFIEDHYCDNGNWTSRTKFIATQLLDISGSTDSFTLYCDSYDKIFPSGSFTSTQETFIRGVEVVSGFAYYSCFPDKYDEYGYMAPCINSICRLDYDNKDKLAFGMSVNRPLNFSLHTPSIYFLENLFEVGRFYCDHLFGSNVNFTKCDVANYIFWYSDRLNSIITPDHSIDFDVPSIWDGIVNFFIELFGGAPIDPLVTAIDFSFLNQTKDFNRICISKQGDKTAYMVIENPKPSTKYVAARYENIETNMCNLIEERDFDGTRICTQEGNNYTIYAGVNISENTAWRLNDINLLWSDAVHTCLGLS